MIYSYPAIYRLLDRRRRWQLWLLLLVMLFASVMNFFGVALVLPFLSLLADPGLIDTDTQFAPLWSLIGAQDHLTTLNILGVVVFATIILALVSQAVTIFWSTTFSRNLAHSLANRRLQIYLSQPYDWFLTRHSSELSKQLLDEVNQVVRLSIQPALRVIANGLICAMLFGLLVAIEPLGALVMALALGAAFAAVFFGLSTRLRKMGIARKAANKERFQVAGEVLGGIKEVKVMGLEAAYLERFHEPSRRIATYQARLAVISEMPRIGVEAVTFGGMMLFTLYLLHVRGLGVADVVPVLGAFAFAGIRLMPTAQALFRDISQMRFGEAALRSLEDDLLRDMPVPVETLADDDAAARREPKVSFDDAITMEAATYTYPGAAEAALQDVTLRIPAGSSVGIVGATGAGKTTVTDLLLGLVQVDGGRLLVDGTAITRHNAKAWQRRIGYVPQMLHLIDDSIARNIDRRASGQEVDQTAVETAARLASLHDFIVSLPEGYNTNVGDGGIRLSGGQLQRVGIARALMKNPDVIIFDEATSALDPITERAVMASLRSLHGTKTLILISHRLQTLSFCDTIFVLEKGRLVDQGTFASLSAKSGGFRKMLEAMK